MASVSRALGVRAPVFAAFRALVLFGGCGTAEFRHLRDENCVPNDF